MVTNVQDSFKEENAESSELKIHKKKEKKKKKKNKRRKVVTR